MVPDYESYNIGFRVAGLIPEPGSLMLAMLSGALCVFRRKR